MTERQTTLVGVFDDGAKAERAIEQLRALGIAQQHIHREEKTRGWDLSHASPKHTDTPEEMKPDFARHGIPQAEARYFEDAYEAGYVLVFVQAGAHEREADEILQRDGAYNKAKRGAEPPEETGAMTPGMRGEDSTQMGVANSAGGTSAANIDPATVEADIEHAQRVFQEQARAREARGQD